MESSRPCPIKLLKQELIFHPLPRAAKLFVVGNVLTIRGVLSTKEGVVGEYLNHATTRKPGTQYSLIETEKLEKMGKKRRVSLNLNKLYALYCCLTSAKILIRKINKIKRMNGRMNNIKEA
jgi:hypothetical protein